MLAVLNRQYASSSATTKLFIDGKTRESQSSKWIDLFNPATNELVTRVPQSTQDEMEQAVVSSKEVSIYTVSQHLKIYTRTKAIYVYRPIKVGNKHLC